MHPQVLILSSTHPLFLPRTQAEVAIAQALEHWNGRFFGIEINTIVLTVMESKSACKLLAT